MGANNTKSLRETIESALQAALSPLHLEVIDESHQHSRRTAKNPETHFKVVIVSAQFEGLNRVKRQQKVYAAVKGLFEEGLHAFAQSTFTPEEWAKSPEVSASPICATKKIVI